MINVFLSIVGIFLMAIVPVGQRYAFTLRERWSLFWVIWMITISFPFQITAQNAYDQWLTVQNSEYHLLGDYKEKKVFGSKTGKNKDLKLIQIQAYRDGRMVWDAMYETYPNLVIYAMDINYTNAENAIATNLLDSSQVSYAFTKDKKMQYYVVDKHSNQHLILTYNEEGLLIKCKDCLSPYGNHEWCAYYMYYYNENKTLQKAESYNLESTKAIDAKVLYSKDSLIYENGLLKTRLTQNPADSTTRKADYTYNKDLLLEKEYSAQSAVYLEPRSYTKTYTYHRNKKLKSETILYYINNKLDGKQVVLYDKKGRKMQQEFYQADGVRGSLYKMRYW